MLLDLQAEPRQPDTDQADHQDRGKHAGGVEILRGAHDELAETGTRAELTQAAYSRFKEASERYGENAGEMTVCKVLEDDAGIHLRVEGVKDIVHARIQANQFSVAAGDAVKLAPQSGHALLFDEKDRRIS